jgi:hypothetical protein
MPFSNATAASPCIVNCPNPVENLTINPESSRRR